MFTETIAIGRHQLIADEPLVEGGKDLGPSPYDFLLAALGSCTAMTVRLYANRKKIRLDKITVKLFHQKQYVEDCKDCEDKNAKIDLIDRKILLAGELSREDKDKLLAIANKCPVHRTLSQKTQINTELIE